MNRGLFILVYLGCLGDTLAAATSCQAIEDDRWSVYAPEVGTETNPVYRVKRIVGLGTADRITSSGTLLNPEAHYLKDVLARDACLDLNISVEVTPQYYWTVQAKYLEAGVVNRLAMISGFTAGAVPLQFRDGLIYKGSTPVLLKVDVEGILNGTLVFKKQLPLPISAAGYTDLFPDQKVVPAGSIRFARHLPSRDTSAASCPTQRAGEENCAGENSLVYRITVPPAFETLGLGIGGNLSVVVRSPRLAFAAMAPVYLATGCCGETKFPAWDNPAIHPSLSTVAKAFRDSNIPFYFFPADSQNPFNRPVLGTIAEGGRQVYEQLKLYTRIFGHKWLHYVGHSKGGLNGRWILGEGARDGSVGIRSILTMNTPHLGALGGELISGVLGGKTAVFFEGPINSFVLGQVLQGKIKEDKPYKTQQDLGFTAVEKFNSNPLFTEPPPETQMKLSSGRGMPIESKTIAADANVDASNELQDVVGPQGNVVSYGVRSISASEVNALSDPQLGLETAGQAMYNLVGKSTSVVFRPLGAQNQISPEISAKPFLFNDIIVNVRSQEYFRPNANTFLPMDPSLSSIAMQPGTARVIAGANHNSVMNGVVGEYIVSFLRKVTR